MNKKSPIRKGDELEHGGEVTGGSPWTNFMGRPLARKGDAALCAQHGPTVIDEGYDRFPDRDGKAVAMHHDRCACACLLISTRQNVNSRTGQRSGHAACPAPKRTSS